MAESDLIQDILSKIEAPIIVILTLIIIRVFFKKLLDSLALRGTISVTGKETVVRIFDISIIVISFLILIAQFIEVHMALIAIAALTLILVFMLIDKIRGFIAYLSLQMDKKIMGKYFEIILPGFKKPIYGRVVKISSTHCEVEDALGEKYLVPNTVMYNAVLKPHTVTLVFDIRLKLTGEGDLRAVIDLFKNFKPEVFRIDDKRSIIRHVGPSTFTIRIVAHPTTPSIRHIEIIDFMSELIGRFKEYNPEVRFVRVY
ncbi:MAG: hypothetical protein LM558_01370 [Thermosphaera sp.]|jgi:hypothetical protein|nr:hypothetical protein [Thermosphaera sp.]